MDYNFEILFKKIEEAKTENAGKNPSAVEIEPQAAEIEEIATLRKIVLEVTETDNSSYTTA